MTRVAPGTPNWAPLLNQDLDAIEALAAAGVAAAGTAQTTADAARQYGGSSVLPTSTVEEALDALGIRLAGDQVTTGNLNALITPGTYLVPGAESTAGNNSPLPGAAGFLTVLRRGTNVMQIFRAFTVSLGFEFARIGDTSSGPTWGAWTSTPASNLSYAGGPALPASTVETALDALDQRTSPVSGSSVDLNTLTSQGVYYCLTAAPNNPAGGTGYLYVTRGAGAVASAIAQRFVNISQDGSGLLAYERASLDSGTTWSSWKRYVAPGNTNTFTARQRFETASEAFTIRRTNGAADARDWSVFVETDGTLHFAPASDSGVLNGDVIRFGRTGGIRRGPNGLLDLYGVGSPEGVVTAPVGSIFRNTEAGGYNGARVWRKDSGSGNSGWVVESGYTGRRNIASALTTPGQVTATVGFATRDNSMVSLQLMMKAEVAFASGGTFFTLPAGLRPWAGHNASPPYSGTGPLAIAENGVATLWAPLAAGASLSWSLTFPSREAWFAALPGTAA